MSENNYERVGRPSSISKYPLIPPIGNFYAPGGINGYFEIDEGLPTRS